MSEKRKDDHRSVAVTLTPELERIIEQRVDSGLYLSADEVVRDALRLLERTDRLQSVALRQAWEEGLGSGDGGVFDLDELRAEGEKALAKEASR